MRLYVVVRETDAEAWAAVQWLYDRMDEGAIAANQRFTSGTDSVGQQRMSAMNGGVKLPDPRSLEVAPNIWSGIGLVRPGPGTAIVGSPDTVIRTLEAYQAAGVETFILSGMPLLEEAYRFGELVLPRLPVERESAGESRSSPGRPCSTATCPPANSRLPEPALPEPALPKPALPEPAGAIPGAGEGVAPELAPLPAAAIRRGNGRGGNGWGGWARLASPLALLLLWQGCSASGLLPARILASPLAVAATAGEMIRSGELPAALAVSFLRVAAGFSVALALGVALAAGAGLSRIGEAVLDPPLQMLKAMPFLGLLPLFILWFGIGEGPKVGLVVVGSLFPIYLTLHAGIRGIDRKLVEAGRTLGLGPVERLRHIVLPGALPSLLVGVRYGLSVAWLSLVVGEQINANTGLGALITNARDFLQTDVIVVCLLVYAGMGLLTDGLVRAIERRSLRWRPSVLAA